MSTLLLDGQHKLTLRDYQVEAIAAVGAAEARGIRRQLIVLPTGSGKTCVFTALAAKRNERTLFLAHRDELIQQAVDKVRLWWPGADIGIVKAERNEVWAQDAVVASVQSLSPKRLAGLGHFGLVVVDECHHGTAASYRRILDALGCGPDEQARTPNAPLLLGVTATPDRADGRGLNDIFDEIVYAKDLLWGIRAGYLCDIRAKEVHLAALDLAKVTVRQGDYAEGELGRALTAANAPRHIYRAWKEHASGRLTLVFMPLVENAVEVAAEFSANGIRSAWVSGAEPIEDRRRKLRDFAEGRIQVLANCQVATEGYDNPAISCVVMGRPTKSRSLYVQMIGRGTRPYPGKEDLLVLDVSGASEGKDLCTVPSLFGMTKRQMGSRGAAEAVGVNEAARETEIARQAKVPEVALVSRDIELFKQVQKQGRVSWSKLRGGSFAVGAGKSSVVLERRGEDAYSVSVLSFDQPPVVLMENVPLALAQGVAEDHIRRNVSAALTDKNARWRRSAPSKKQVEALGKWRIAVPENATAGDASDLLDAALASARLSRSRKMAAR